MKKQFLTNKEDCNQCFERIEAWFHQDIIDRAPIRFHRHNTEYETVLSDSKHASLKERWMDAEFQAESFLNSVRKQRFLGETFPVYMPNLGPNFFAAVHGAELEFGETTSWCKPIVNDESDIEKIKFSRENPYYKKMHELTRAALDICKGEFFVGYTDIHPGMDCAAAWRGSEKLCLDMMLNPNLVKKLMLLAEEHFLEVYDEFDTLLKACDQPSVTWINTPIPDGRLHVPCNDFSFMISPEQFDEFAMSMLRNEIKTMTHNIFHVDGIGVANHIDSILSVNNINCIQWVQGMGDDFPIMQHLPFIKYVQSKGVSIIVDLNLSDLDRFMQEVRPRGIFLWIATQSVEQEREILRKLLKWK